MEDFEKAIKARNLQVQANLIGEFSEEDSEFSKGHPVGYINKYGKQKQGDGSWKYVGRGQRGTTPSNQTAPTTPTAPKTTQPSNPQEAARMFGSWLKDNAGLVARRNPVYVPHINSMLEGSGFRAQGDSRTGFYIIHAASGHKILENKRLAPLVSQIKSLASQVSSPTNPPASSQQTQSASTPKPAASTPKPTTETSAALAEPSEQAKQKATNKENFKRLDDRVSSALERLKDDGHASNHRHVQELKTAHAEFKKIAAHVNKKLGGKLELTTQFEYNHRYHSFSMVLGFNKFDLKAKFPEEYAAHENLSFSQSKENDFAAKKGGELLSKYVQGGTHSSFGQRSYSYEGSKVGWSMAHKAGSDYRPRIASIK